MKNNLYVGLAIADSMFPPNCKLIRQNLSLDEAKTRLAGGYLSCINPSHRATVAALKSKYGIDIDTPDTAPTVNLKEGDSILCLSVRGLPRLDGSRTQYSEEEINNSEFSYGLWTVQNIGPVTGD